MEKIKKIVLEIGKYFKENYSSNIFQKTVSMLVVVCFIINIVNLPAFASENRVKDNKEKNEQVMESGKTSTGEVGLVNAQEAMKSGSGEGVSRMNAIGNMSEEEVNSIIEIDEQNGVIKDKTKGNKVVAVYNAEKEQVLGYAGQSDIIYYQALVNRKKSLEKGGVSQKEQKVEEKTDKKAEKETVKAGKTAQEIAEVKGIVIGEYKPEEQTTQTATEGTTVQKTVKEIPETKETVIETTQKQEENIQTNTTEQNKKEVVEKLSQDTGVNKEEVEKGLDEALKGKTEEEKESVIGLLKTFFDKGGDIVNCAVDVLAKVLDVHSKGLLGLQALLVEISTGLFVKNNEELIKSGETQLMTSMSTVQQVMEQYGKEAEGYSTDIENFIANTKSGESSIVWVNSDHYITVTRLEDGNYGVADSNVKNGESVEYSAEGLKAVLSGKEGVDVDGKKVGVSYKAQSKDGTIKVLAVSEGLKLAKEEGKVEAISKKEMVKIKGANTDNNKNISIGNNGATITDSTTGEKKNISFDKNLTKEELEKEKQFIKKYGVSAWEEHIRGEGLLKQETLYDKEGNKIYDATKVGYDANSHTIALKYDFFKAYTDDIYFINSQSTKLLVQSYKTDAATGLLKEDVSMVYAVASNASAKDYTFKNGITVTMAISNIDRIVEKGEFVEKDEKDDTGKNVKKTYQEYRAIDYSNGNNINNGIPTGLEYIKVSKDGHKDFTRHELANYTMEDSKDSDEKEKITGNKKNNEKTNSGDATDEDNVTKEYKKMLEKTVQLKVKGYDNFYDGYKYVSDKYIIGVISYSTKTQQYVRSCKVGDLDITAQIEGVGDNWRYLKTVSKGAKINIQSKGKDINGKDVVYMAAAELTADSVWEEIDKNLEVDGSGVVICGYTKDDKGNIVYDPCYRISGKYSATKGFYGADLGEYSDYYTSIKTGDDESIEIYNIKRTADGKYVAQHSDDNEGLASTGYIAASGTYDDVGEERKAYYGIEEGTVFEKNEDGDTVLKDKNGKETELTDTSYRIYLFPTKYDMELIEKAYSETTTTKTTKNTGQKILSFFGIDSKTTTTTTTINWATWNGKEGKLEYHTKTTTAKSTTVGILWGLADIVECNKHLTINDDGVVTEKDFGNSWGFKLFWEDTDETLAGTFKQLAEGKIDFKKAQMKYINEAGIDIKNYTEGTEHRVDITINNVAYKDNGTVQICQNIRSYRSNGSYIIDSKNPLSVQTGIYYTINGIQSPNQGNGFIYNAKGISSRVDYDYKSDGSRIVVGYGNFAQNAFIGGNMCVATMITNGTYYGAKTVAKAKAKANNEGKVQVDKNGNVVYETDENGRIKYETENGEIIYNETDETGKSKYETGGNGEFIYEIDENGKIIYSEQSWTGMTNYSSNAETVIGEWFNSLSKEDKEKMRITIPNSDGEDIILQLHYEDGELTYQAVGNKKLSEYTFNKTFSGNEGDRSFSINSIGFDSSQGFYVDVGLQLTQEEFKVTGSTVINSGDSDEDVDTPKEVKDKKYSVDVSIDGENMILKATDDGSKHEVSISFGLNELTSGSSVIENYSFGYFYAGTEITFYDQENKMVESENVGRKDVSTSTNDLGDISYQKITVMGIENGSKVLLTTNTGLGDIAGAIANNGFKEGSGNVINEITFERDSKHVEYVKIEAKMEKGKNWEKAKKTFYIGYETEVKSADSTGTVKTMAYRVAKKGDKMLGGKYDGKGKVKISFWKGSIDFYSSATQITVKRNGFVKGLLIAAGIAASMIGIAVSVAGGVAGGMAGGLIGGVPGIVAGGIVGIGIMLPLGLGLFKVSASLLKDKKIENVTKGEILSAGIAGIAGAAIVVIAVVGIVAAVKTAGASVAVAIAIIAAITTAFTTYFGAKAAFDASEGYQMYAKTGNSDYLKEAILNTFIFVISAISALGIGSSAAGIVNSFITGTLKTALYTGLKYALIGAGVGTGVGAAVSGIKAAINKEKFKFFTKEMGIGALTGFFIGFSLGFSIGASTTGVKEANIKNFVSSKLISFKSAGVLAKIGNVVGVAIKAVDTFITVVMARNMIDSCINGDIDGAISSLYVMFSINVINPMLSESNEVPETTKKDLKFRDVLKKTSGAYKSVNGNLVYSGTTLARSIIMGVVGFGAGYVLGLLLNKSKDGDGIIPFVTATLFALAFYGASSAIATGGYGNLKFSNITEGLRTISVKTFQMTNRMLQFNLELQYFGALIGLIRHAAGGKKLSEDNSWWGKFIRTIDNFTGFGVVSSAEALIYDEEGNFSKSTVFNREGVNESAINSLSGVLSPSMLLFSAGTTIFMPILNPALMNSPILGTVMQYINEGMSGLENQDFLNTVYEEGFKENVLGIFFGKSLGESTEASEILQELLDDTPDADFDMDLLESESSRLDTERHITEKSVKEATNLIEKVRKNDSKRNEIINNNKVFELLSNDVVNGLIDGDKKYFVKGDVKNITDSLTREVVMADIISQNVISTEKADTFRAKLDKVKLEGLSFIQMANYIYGLACVYASNNDVVFNNLTEDTLKDISTKGLLHLFSVYGRMDNEGKMALVVGKIIKERINEVVFAINEYETGKDKDINKILEVLKKQKLGDLSVEIENKITEIVGSINQINKQREGKTGVSQSNNEEADKLKEQLKRKERELDGYINTILKNLGITTQLLNAIGSQVSVKWALFGDAGKEYDNFKTNREKFVEEAQNLSTKIADIMLKSEFERIKEDVGVLKNEMEKLGENIKEEDKKKVFNAKKELVEALNELATKEEMTAIEFFRKLSLVDANEMTLGQWWEMKSDDKLKNYREKASNYRKALSKYIQNIIDSDFRLQKGLSNKELILLKSEYLSKISTMGNKELLFSLDFDISSETSVIASGTVIDLKESIRKKANLVDKQTINEIKEKNKELQIKINGIIEKAENVVNAEEGSYDKAIQDLEDIELRKYMIANLDLEKKNSLEKLKKDSIKGFEKKVNEVYDNRKKEIEKMSVEKLMSYYFNNTKQNALNTQQLSDKIMEKLYAQYADCAKNNVEYEAMKLFFDKDGIFDLLKNSDYGKNLIFTEQQNGKIKQQIKKVFESFANNYWNKFDSSIKDFINDYNKKHTENEIRATQQLKDVINSGDKETIENLKDRMIKAAFGENKTDKNLTFTERLALDLKFSEIASGVWKYEKGPLQSYEANNKETRANPTGSLDKAYSEEGNIDNYGYGFLGANLKKGTNTGNQVLMLCNNLLGRVSSLSAGGGKTFVYTWTIDQYFSLNLGNQLKIAEIFGAKSTDSAQLSGAGKDDVMFMWSMMQIEAVNGEQQYQSGSKDGYKELIHSYTDKMDTDEQGNAIYKGRVITYSLGQRGFVELQARINNRELNKALDNVSLRIADEADVAALSRTAFILGIGDKTVDKLRAKYTVECLQDLQKIVVNGEQIKANTKAKTKGDLAEHEFAVIDGKVVCADELDKLILKEFKDKSDTDIHIPGLHSLKEKLTGGEVNKLEDLGKYKGEVEVSQIMRAMYVMQEGADNMESVAFVNGQPASIQAGSQSNNTTDQSSTYNVALVALKIQELMKADDKNFDISKMKLEDYHYDKGKNKYDVNNVKISVSSGESTISQIFSRNQSTTLNFGGSATLDVAREVAQVIFGGLAVDIEASSIKKIIGQYNKEGKEKRFKVVPFEKQGELAAGEQIINKAVTSAVEFLKGENQEKDSKGNRVGLLFGAMDMSYNAEVMIKALAELSNGNFTYQQIIDATKGKTLTQILNYISDNYKNMKQYTKQIQIIDADVAGNNSDAVVEMSQKRGMLTFSNESGLRGVDFKSINMIILDGHNFPSSELLQAIGRAGRNQEWGKDRASVDVYMDKDSIKTTLDKMIEVYEYYQQYKSKRLFNDNDVTGENNLKFNDIIAGNIMADNISDIDILEVVSTYKSKQLKSESILFKARQEATNLLVKEPLAEMAAKARDSGDVEGEKFLNDLYEKAISNDEGNLFKKDIDKLSDPMTTIRQIFAQVLKEAEVYLTLAQDHKFKDSSINIDFIKRLIDIKSMSSHGAFENLEKKELRNENPYFESTFAQANREVDFNQNKSPAEDVARVLIKLSKDVLPTATFENNTSTVVMVEDAIKTESMTEEQKKEADKYKAVLETDTTLSYENSKGKKVLTEKGKIYAFFVNKLAMPSQEWINFINSLLEVNKDKIGYVNKDIGKISKNIKDYNSDKLKEILNKFVNVLWDNNIKDSKAVENLFNSYQMIDSEKYKELTIEKLQQIINIKYEPGLDKYIKKISKYSLPPEQTVWLAKSDLLSDKTLQKTIVDSYDKIKDTFDKQQKLGIIINQKLKGKFGIFVEEIKTSVPLVWYKFVNWLPLVKKGYWGYIGKLRKIGKELNPELADILDKEKTKDEEKFVNDIKSKMALAGIEINENTDMAIKNMKNSYSNLESKVVKLRFKNIHWLSKIVSFVLLGIPFGIKALRAKSKLKEKYFRLKDINSFADMPQLIKTLSKENRIELPKKEKSILEGLFKTKEDIKKENLKLMEGRPKDNLLNNLLKEEKTEANTIGRMKKVFEENKGKDDAKNILEIAFNMLYPAKKTQVLIKRYQYITENFQFASDVLDDMSISEIADDNNFVDIENKKPEENLTKEIKVADKTIETTEKFNKKYNEALQGITIDKLNEIKKSELNKFRDTKLEEFKEKKDKKLNDKEIEQEFEKYFNQNLKQDFEKDFEQKLKNGDIKYSDVVKNNYDNIVNYVSQKLEPKKEEKPKEEVKKTAKQEENIQEQIPEEPKKEEPKEEEIEPKKEIELKEEVNEEQKGEAKESKEEESKEDKKVQEKTSAQKMVETFTIKDLSNAKLIKQLKNVVEKGIITLDEKTTRETIVKDIKQLTPKQILKEFDSVDAFIDTNEALLEMAGLNVEVIKENRGYIKGWVTNEKSNVVKEFGNNKNIDLEFYLPWSMEDLSELKPKKVTFKKDLYSKKVAEVLKEELEKKTYFELMAENKTVENKTVHVFGDLAAKKQEEFLKLIGLDKLNTNKYKLEKALKESQWKKYQKDNKDNKDVKDNKKNEKEEIVNQEVKDIIENIKVKDLNDNAYISATTDLLKAEMITSENIKGGKEKVKEVIEEKKYVELAKKLNNDENKADNVLKAIGMRKAVNTIRTLRTLKGVSDNKLYDITMKNMTIKDLLDEKTADMGIEELDKKAKELIGKEKITDNDINEMTLNKEEEGIIRTAILKKAIREPNLTKAKIAGKVAEKLSATSTKVVEISDKSAFVNKKVGTADIGTDIGTNLKDLIMATGTNSALITNDNAIKEGMMLVLEDSENKDNAHVITVMKVNGEEIIYAENIREGKKDVIIKATVKIKDLENGVIIDKDGKLVPKEEKNKFKWNGLVLATDKIINKTEGITTIKEVQDMLGIEKDTAEKIGVKKIKELVKGVKNMDETKVIKGITKPTLIDNTDNADLVKTGKKMEIKESTINSITKIKKYSPEVKAIAKMLGKDNAGDLKKTDIAKKVFENDTTGKMKMENKDIVNMVLTKMSYLSKQGRGSTADVELAMELTAVAGGLLLAMNSQEVSNVSELDQTKINGNQETISKLLKDEYQQNFVGTDKDFIIDLAKLQLAVEKKTTYTADEKKDILDALAGDGNVINKDAQAVADVFKLQYKVLAAA